MTRPDRLPSFLLGMTRSKPHTHRRRSALLASLLAVIAAGASAACSTTASTPSDGGSGTGGAGGGGSSGTGGSSGSGGSSGATGAGGAGGSGFTKTGVCAQRGTATADASSYDGTEEFALIGDEGLGADVCVVRYDVKRVAAAPAGCTVCLWTHLVEYSNPTVVTDVNGACANSELALTTAKIAAMSMTRVGIGFAKDLNGAHGSARMRYFDAMAKWDVYGNASWDEAAKAFTYDYRTGICAY